MNRTGPFCALLLVVAGVLSTASAAEAATATRLGKVRGPQWSRVRAVLQLTLSKRSELNMVSADAEAIVRGKVSKGGRGLVATISVHDAEGQAKTKARFSGVDSRGLIRDIQERAWDELGPALVAIGAPPAEEAKVVAPSRAPVQAAKSKADEEEAASRAREAERAKKARAEEAAEKRRQAREAREAREAQEAEASRTRAAKQSAAAASPTRTETRRSTEGGLGAPGALDEDAIRLAMGLGFFSRSFSWTDDIFEDLAAYELGGAPMFRVGAQWFPGAHLSDGIAGWFGAELDFELPFAVDSEVGLVDAEGQVETVSFPTSASAWRVGLVGRIPLEVFEVSLGLGYGERRFHLEVSDGGLQVTDLPEVRYQTLDARLALLLRISETVDISAFGNWGFMLDSGPIGRFWFPRSSSHMAGAGGQVTVHVTEGVGVFGRFDWQGAFFDLQPEPGDTYVAGGASDTYMSASLGLSYVLGG